MSEFKDIKEPEFHPRCVLCGRLVDPKRKFMRGKFSSNHKLNALRQLFIGQSGIKWEKRDLNREELEMLEETLEKVLERVQKKLEEV